MPLTQVTAAPFVVTKPYIRIGDLTTGYEVECALTHLTAEPSQDENTVETFCGTYTSYSKEQWTITMTVAMSYGATGFWNSLRPYCNTIKAFAIRPDQATAVGVANPELSGNGFIKAFAFIDADPGGVSEIDFEIGVQGALSQDTGSGPVPMMMAAETGGETVTVA